MASIKSLGIASPSALAHAVSEGILPPDPPSKSYRWQRCVDDTDGQSAAGEELLLTDYCAIWSKGGVVQRSFRFDFEREKIRYAIFARFPNFIVKVGEEGPGRSTSPSGLSVKKQREAPHGADTKLPEPEPGGGQKGNAFGPETQSPRVAQLDRALVVVLKSEAHIFFLAGTSHVISLPFEVGAVFALPCGIILQRQVMNDGVEPLSSPPLPSAPSNSFAFSQVTSSFNNVASQSFSSAAETGPGSTVDPGLSFTSLLPSPKSKRKDEDLPGHIYLRDPLVEPGLLYDIGQSGPRDWKKGGVYRPLRLHRREQLLYLSRRSEVDVTLLDQDYPDHVLVAVTVDRKTGKYSVWVVRENSGSRPVAHKQRMSMRSSGTAARRKSSRMPGTGANTPSGRAVSGMRESFGGMRESSQFQEVSEDEPDAASQLDPAFENPGAPAKSSRRISSLLARSDLSFNPDPSDFFDRVTGHGAKRGSSFGPRTSLQGIFGRPQTGRRHAKSLSPDLTSSGISSVSIDGMLDDPKSDEDLDEASRRDPRGISDTSRTTLTLKRIHSFSNDGFSSNDSDIAAPSPRSERVFTLKAPASDPSLAREFILCVLNRSAKRLSVLYLSVRHGRRARRSGQQAAFDVQVTSMGGGLGVMDACEVQDPSGHSRLLVLSQAAPGLVELALQSPWSTKLVLQLPERFIIRNPYTVDPAFAYQRKRETGLRRILSDKIDALFALEPYSCLGEFDGQDAAGTWHRLGIQLSPQSPFVSKAISVGEYVLPRSSAEREPLLRAWWDVIAWLKRRPDNLLQDEWAAFVVVVCLHFIPSLSNRQKPSTVSKRRKTGLRSSSGANIDQEAFEAMVASEDIAGSGTSTWLQESSWQWIAEIEPAEPSRIRPGRASGTSNTLKNPFVRKISFLLECMSLAREFSKTEAGQAAAGDQGYLPTSSGTSAETRLYSLPKLSVALHLFCEELKLDVLATDKVHALNPLLAQLATWLKWNDWLKDSSCCYMLSDADMERWAFDENTVQSNEMAQPGREPPSVLAYVAALYQGQKVQPYPTLLDLKQPQASSTEEIAAVAALTPRTRVLFALLQIKDLEPIEYVHAISAIGRDITMIDSFPEAIAAPLRSKIAACQARPGSNLSTKLLEMIDRSDIAMLDQKSQINKAHSRSADVTSHESTRDFHTISNAALDVDTVGAYDGQAELDRLAVTRLVFKDDQRFIEASKLLHPLKPAVARCIPLPEWTEADLLEAQHELVKIVAIRTLSVSPGRGLLYYCGRFPLLTEKFPIHGFTLSCVMKPTNTTVTADRSVYTEEKVSWAFFHAGVEAGLSISKAAKGVDTSWITFNKPTELNNRHAGFLLALGLNGHLKSIAKWVAFKYLTPKHTMTSIGLLLGLAASYRGTMDPLITRLLSVHVTRMLPPGAAELNLSPLTQTTGIMSIGLLYCETQHRRMSEVMISEMENIEQDESISPADILRDEGYRLAAGFALGYINLGHGKDLKGLHDMQIVERLLSLAVATKRVDLVHVLDKATAAATLAIALIFLKTEDRALAKKIDVPDTVHQFDYVRPDIFLLRTVACHLIMWNEITPTMDWMENQLPTPYKSRVKLTNTRGLHTEDLPLFNILAGLCLSIGLRFAGSARGDVRNLLGHYLDQFLRIVHLPAPTYDGRLTRITARNCQDTVALAAASVMAGTGDVWLLRRLRRLHGRTDPDTPYGSHMAAHLALGTLFLGGGTHTFSTRNSAIASLLAAFYPLFPTAVLDNKAHLQAFRHLWALAAEPRCLVVRSADAACRPLSLPVTIKLRDSGKVLQSTAPCLLPELDRVASVSSNDQAYWPVTLDLAGNPAHAAAFRRHQSLFVRRRGASDALTSSTHPGAAFSATMRALNERAAPLAFEWVFTLPALASLDSATRAKALPPEVAGGAMLLHATAAAGRTTEADDRLALERECMVSGKAERLWSLKALFAWVESGRGEQTGAEWLGREALEGLRAQVMLKGSRGAG